VVVGADGIRSVVARDLGVARPARLGRRVGITWHMADPAGDDPHDARMVVLDGAYCGLAPVPGGRLNVGIVLSGRDRLRALASRGAAAVGAEIIHEAIDRDRRTQDAPTTAAIDAVAGAAPLGHRVSRRSGPGWMLIGDAAGFLDPFTGEGIHRALVSARRAADVLTAQPFPVRDFSGYDRAMRARFAGKDLVSMLVQAFLARPLAFEYTAHRLATRDRSRDTMGLVMGDLLPAYRALDPRFIAALLAP
jgi:flavin-dependent dehydrogenase